MIRLAVLSSCLFLGGWISAVCFPSIAATGEAHRWASQEASLPAHLQPSFRLSKSRDKSLGSYEKAAAYAMSRDGDALLIIENDRVALEQYGKGFTANKPQSIGSGTKILSGLIAVAAVQDDLLELDEPAARTITEWKTHPLRSKVTIRQLLSLTSGFSGGKIGQIPTYATAVKAPLIALPGRSFQYGPVPFQIFGELMRRKLASRQENAVTYLKHSILTPIGLNLSSWKLNPDGNPDLASGAVMTARDWGKLGRLLVHQGRWNSEKVLNKKLLKQCYKGSSVNPSYGIAFWLNAPGLSPFNKPQQFLAPAPEDAVMAAGADGQRLYIIPSQKLVIVRFGHSSRFEDEAFLSLLPR